MEKTKIDLKPISEKLNEINNNIHELIILIENIGNEPSKMQ